jgi:hypothetical protein
MAKTQFIVTNPPYSLPTTKLINMFQKEKDVREKIHPK